MPYVSMVITSYVS